MNDINEVLHNGKALFLAYDQGFEHGPTDFNEKNVDPTYILDIAHQSDVFTAIIFHEGIAQQYYDPQKESTPLIIKLNGKTSFHVDEEPYSPQLCSVSEAKRLGAKGVGYTIYIGSEYEGKMMQEFSKIEDDAHRMGMSVTMWAYPRGKHVAGRETSKDIVAYAARLALEMGADFVKIPYTGDITSFSWVVKSAGRTKVVVQGGAKKDRKEFLEEITSIMESGATGLAIGRNIWQSDDPIGLSKAIAKIVYGQ